MANVARLSKVAIKNAIFDRVKAVALGNTKRGLKEVASDLLNDQGRDKASMKAICEGTFLSRTTVERVMDLADTESGEAYRPQSETLERVFRYCNAEITFNEVSIKPSFRNQPKED